MDAALDKLRAVMPRDRQEHVERLAQRTVILARPVRPGSAPAEHPCLLDVQRAVARADPEIKGVMIGLLANREVARFMLQNGASPLLQPNDVVAK